MKAFVVCIALVLLIKWLLGRTYYNDDSGQSHAESGILGLCLIPVVLFIFVIFVL